MPFEVGIENQKEIKIINDTYNINEAKTKAKDKVKEKILQSLDKDEYILDEKTLNFYQKDSKINLKSIADAIRHEPNKKNGGII